MSGKSLRDKIIERMELLGIEPKRSLGQNFLISEVVVDRILAAAKPEDFKKTIEIGPGLGALTDLLSEKSKALELIELDKTFAQFWREQGHKVTEVDALKYSWSELLDTQAPYLLVSNLPYQISSRLVVDLSLISKSFHRMVLMFQKEVGQRLLASEGSEDYGLLTVVAQCFWKIHLVTEAGAVDFMPKPNVASRVLIFDRKANIPLEIFGKDFLNFLKTSFASRRKKLLPKLVGYQQKDQLIQIFEDLNLSVDIRCEKLSPEDFIALYLALKKEY